MDVRLFWQGMRGLLRPKKDSMRVFEDERRSTLTPALSLKEREKGGTVRGVTLTLRERVRVRGDNA